MLSLLTGIWDVFRHAFRKRVTVQYPEQRPALPSRYRGRIILSRDPDGGERCVACYLCAVACPVDCIALQAKQDATGRRYPEFFRINFSRCIFCGYCEDACRTYAIQLTPDFEIDEYHRPNMVYEKEDLMISGEGKYPGYNFWRVAGVAIEGKPEGASVTPRQVGMSLFRPYVVAVELASMLLLSGVVGAYHVGFREEEKKKLETGTDSDESSISAGDLVHSGTRRPDRAP